MIKTILTGQVLSLMLCGTGTSATALSNKYNVRTPCFNAFLMYTLLASTFGVYVIIKKDFMKIMKKHWWKYFSVALLDVEANYLLTKAYAYTTLTSVQVSEGVIFVNKKVYKVHEKHAKEIYEHVHLVFIS